MSKYGQIHNLYNSLEMLLRVYTFTMEQLLRYILQKALLKNYNIKKHNDSKIKIKHLLCSILI